MGKVFWRAVMLSVLVCPGVPEAAFAAEEDPVARAAVLHKKATQAYRQENLREAIDLWKAAEALDPLWKYAFNLASAHMEGREWIDAWKATNRATAYGVPPDRGVLIGEAREEIAQRLEQTHSQVVLDVRPLDAKVRLNGRLWKAPRDTWVAGPTCNVEIESPGHVSKEFTWEVGIGQRVRRNEALERLGVVEILAGEEGAILFVDGRSIGELGVTRRFQLESGEHTVRVVYEGRTLLSDVVLIEPGARVTLSAGSGARRAVFTSTVAPWFLVGTGATLSVIGGVFTSQAAGHHDGLLDLIADNPNGFTPGQEDEYYKLIDERNSAATLSYVMYGVGGAAIVAGIVWLVLDDGGDELAGSGNPGEFADAEGERALQWAIVPQLSGGVSATAQWSF
jgi:hypothetical protein